MKMTNGVLNATVSTNYNTKTTQNATAKEGGTKSISQEKTTKADSKVEQLKARIESGEYTIDIDSLAQTMAKELLS